MMNFVDGALLNLAEGICHRIQRLTGRTNIWIALQLTNLSIVLYFIWAAEYFWRWRGPTGFRIYIAVFCGILMFILAQTVFRTPIESLEANAYRRVAKGLRNPRRIRDVMLRVLFLGLSLFLMGPLSLAYLTMGLRLVILMQSLSVLTTIVLYLLACDPLPPTTGKVWEWLGQFGRVGTSVPQRIPVSPKEPARRSADREKRIA